MSENSVAAKIVECDLLPTGGSLKEKTSLLNGIVELTYFESIRSPSISLKIHLIDVDGFISIIYRVFTWRGGFIYSRSSVG